MRKVDMIRNLDGVADAVGAWIKDQITKANLTTAVVGLSGGADSALVALLCKRSDIPLIVVKMPCNSSQSSLDRADELIKKFGLNAVQINLEQAFETIVEQATYQGLYKLHPAQNKAAAGALRSCLRAPTLDFIAKLNNGLIVGTGNRDEDEVTRYFQKRGDGAVDISPIAKLHKSEVYQLLKHLGCTEAIIKAVPTADLWGPDAGQEDEKELGLTYQEIEWGIKTMQKAGFYSPDDWHDHPSIPLNRMTSMRQIEVLKKLIHLEEVSKHKAELPPVFNVRAMITLFEDDSTEDGDED